MDLLQISTYFRTITGKIFRNFFLLNLENLDCRPVKLEKNVFKCFIGIFEILEHSFLSEHFQKNIYGRIFSSVVGCRL